ncbi:MAG: DUF4276 family protein [Gammaproteobacteria bacterium]|nr:DUF4276 family protein [Gammaproteobacteria bacterium]
MTGIYIATEDPLSEAVADRLVLEADQGLRVVVRLRKKGFGHLKRKLPDLVKLAYNIPVFLCTDLDRTECPPALIAAWCGKRRLPDKLLFRVAVRETEAWLLADRESFAEFSGTPLSKVPSTPETLDDPKQHLLELVRRYGSRELKADILPAPKTKAKVGFGYNLRLSKFVKECWSVEQAATNADSLYRTLCRLRELGGLRITKPCV